MVAIKTHQASAFLNALDRVPQAVLFYGSDVGLVSERAAQLAKALAGRDDPPGEILRLDDSSLEDDPDRIFVELQTAPMFGGRKVVRAAAGRRVTAAQLKTLVEGGNLAGSLIVEAGNLRPDDALRALFEKSPAAAAVACFPDEARDLDVVIREVFAGRGVQITPEARRLLMTRLGADRALSRSEIDKLALYAHGKSVIDEEDVEIAVGDAAELALDRIVMAARLGQRRRCARRVRPQHRLGRKRAGRHRRAAAPFPAAAPHARGARCRPVDGGGAAHRCARRRTSSSATRSSSRAAAGAQQSSTPHWRASPRRPRPRGSTPRSKATLTEKLLLDLGGWREISGAKRKA